MNADPTVAEALRGVTGPLYMAFIKRDIPDYNRFQLPEESDCTYELYRDLIMQLSAEVEADAETMAKALNRINQERAQHSSKFITDPLSVRLPKRRSTKIQPTTSYGIKPRFATATTIHGEQLRFKERSEAPRDPAKKNNIFASRKNKALAVPTHRLNSRASQITHVPKSLIEDHKRPATQNASSRQIVAPRAPAIVPPKTPNTQPSGATLQAREARLRALTATKASSASTSRDSTLSKSPLSRPTTPASSTPQRIPLALDSRKKSSSNTSSSPKIRASTKSASSSSTPENFRSRPKVDGEGHLSPEPLTSPLKLTKRPRLPSDDEDAPLHNDPVPNEATPKPRPVIRKRPEPSIFIQPKRKKI